MIKAHRIRFPRFMSTDPATATSPSLPPLARLPPLFRPPLPIPLYLDSLTRATLPASSLSAHHNRHPYLSKPTPARLTPEALLATVTSSSITSDVTRRSLSIGSLKKVVLKHEDEFLHDGGVLTRSREESDDVDGMSWGDWWPFSIRSEVETLEVNTDGSRSLLDSYAGDPGDTDTEVTRTSPKVSPTLPFSSIFSAPLAFTLGSDYYSTSNPIHRRYSSATRKPVDKEYLDEEDTEAANLEEANDLDVYELIKERYRCPRFPIVFAHGLFGFDTIGHASLKPLQISYW